ncbi:MULTISPECIES: hypothetical protein [Thermoanaerobacterium]|uniref:Bypass of forespore C C-terminal domain-containing protein n=1 Tax=Thermoanaerobacterium butyriciformans TaxID=1702242 RepID=A0ABS4NHI7_9THEO|nr:MULTISPECIES: hypothetical protein [Thermoanaerobacterium]MBP2072604.1 hypothetical protein [Thermoanaerobacterium butyriciformans]WKV09244.1 hypothetical protein Q2T46_01945 [Thermoanaerobacterium sp. CMT5567-10]
MKFRGKRAISIILIFIVIIFLAGYIYYIKFYSRPSKIPQYTKTNVNSAMTRETIVPDGKLLFETLYKGNGDLIREEQKISASLYGKSKEDIAKIYSDWSIKKFSNDMIVLYKEENGFPPGYYIISSSDGYVSLFKSDGNGGSSLVEKTDILVNNLNPNDKERILNNIVVKDIDEAYSILANLSS